MATFKCKMCRGLLEIEPGMKVCKCEYCGSTQTLPDFDNEKKVKLFNRANNFRLRNEFDMALVTYSQIVTEFPKDPEAHFGMVLSRYGIEYVDDPLTGKKIPTCHRTIVQSVFDDEDYKAAIANADVVGELIYQNEAKEIDRIQKEIIALSSKEEPYDVFICYKETGEDGQRTLDSVRSQDIYERLTEKGYRVFFARITLEDKLGKDYEPIIYAALTSSKVMLAVSTEPEHFEAVWVKNEWSRYLDFMRADRKKSLIPCYENMDPYDMPEQFKNLQAQDMSKIGWLQDLTRGVEKLIGKKQETIKQVVVTQTPTGGSLAQPYVDKGFQWLEKGELDRAKKMFDDAMSYDENEPLIYLGLLLVQYNATSVEKLCESSNTEVLSSEHYQKFSSYKEQKAVEYAKRISSCINSNNCVCNAKGIIEKLSDSSLFNIEDAIKAKETLSKALEYNGENQKAKELESYLLEFVYALGSTHFESNDPNTVTSSEPLFKFTIDYKDSKEKLGLLTSRTNEASISNIKRYLSNSSDIDCATVIKMAEDFVLDESERNTLIEECKKKNDADCESILQVYVYKNDVVAIKENANEIIGKFYDKSLAEEYSKKCENCLVKRFIFLVNSGVYSNVTYSKKYLDEYLKNNSQYDVFLLKSTRSIKRARARIIRNSSITVSIITIVSLLLTFGVFVPMSKYNKGMEYFSQGDYESAINYYEQAPSWNDSYRQRLLAQAGICFKNGDYEEGISCVQRAGGHVTIDYDTNGGESPYSNDYYTDIWYDEPVKRGPILRGYRFVGWKIANFDIVNSKGNYGARLTLLAQWSDPCAFNIIYDLDGGTNNHSNPETYTVEDGIITLQEPTKNGYSFTGWRPEYYYDPDWDYDWVRDDSWNSSQTITAIDSKWCCDVKLVAHWSLKTYTITYILNGGMNSSLNPKTYTVKDDVTFYDPQRAYFIFDGWYEDYSFTRKITSFAKGDYYRNLELFAKWSPTSTYKYATIPLYLTYDHKTIAYGLYPQTRVSDSSLISRLNALTPTTSGYYLDESDGTYYYPCVAKPHYSSDIFDDGTTIMSGTKYWFRCEPISWKVLQESHSALSVVSDRILDAHQYNESYSGTKSRTDYQGNSATVYANNYKYSEIRSWLNTDFLDMAFALGSSNIKTVTVDNSAATTNASPNKNACESTSDKVYLLSYKDYTNESYGFPSSSARTSLRECKTTDFARARGASSSTSSDYLNNGEYWTRSPSTNSWGWYVTADGLLHDGASLNHFSFGVRPAITLSF